MLVGGGPQAGRQEDAPKPIGCADANRPDDRLCFAGRARTRRRRPMAMLARYNAEGPEEFALPWSTSTPGPAASARHFGSHSLLEELRKSRRIVRHDELSARNDATMGDLRPADSRVQPCRPDAEFARQRSAEFDIRHGDLPTRR